MIIYDQDDLGESGGKKVFENADEVRQQILGWNVDAVGTRPEDYLQRDLMISPCHRDPRLWRFHKLRKNSPYWLYDGLHGLNEYQRQIIATLRCFLFDYLLGLSSLRKNADDVLLRLIDRLWRCWPIGAQFSWRGEGVATNRDVCDLTKFCPFCLARSVLDLHDRIKKGPLRDPNGKFVLLGSLSFSDEDFVLENSPIATTKRLHYVRDTLGGYLRSAAEDLGCQGGLVVVQFGPKLFPSPVWDNDSIDYFQQQGFRYTVSVLGETGQWSAGRLIDLRKDPSQLAPFSFGEQRISPTWKVIDATEPSSLRRLLIGTSRGYRQSNSPYGDSGAFAVQMWRLANAQQWSDAMTMSRGIRSHDAWGSWRGHFARESMPALQNASHRRGRSKRAQNLKAVNSARKEVADTRRRDLAITAQPIFADLSFQFGRPPGHDLLREVMGEWLVSDRDARWLVKHLSTESHQDHDILVSAPVAG